ncbi:HdeD family acid-resistance protein [Methylolobus aquaticus]
MQIRDRFVRFERFGTDWKLLLLRGAALFMAGGSLALGAWLNPDATILRATGFSVLPLAALLVFALGCLEIFDTVLATKLGDFVLHLNMGVFDLVVGLIMLFSLGGTPERLVLLVIAYLIVKAAVRTALAYAAQLPDRRSIAIGAGISLVLGLTIWIKPVTPGWLLAFAVSVDIALRGWTFMMFSFWLRKQQPGGSATDRQGV